ncbi:hypothetical protein [Catellatospora sichuanensis]|uniref:hypothetical protein n=1 Tax=Catellatospora sichuanensis TaxID=1969805 RepID=UPI0011831162|nr:hypothetical protein [Catellatospora sichuanensis]
MADKPMPQLAVDMVEVRKVTADLRARTNDGLAPGVGQFAREIERGVLFGTFSPSGETQAARNAFWAALQRHHANATRQLEVGQTLAAALEKVLANYTEADDLAAMKLSVLERELMVAVERLEIAELRHQQGRGAYI